MCGIEVWWGEGVIREFQQRLVYLLKLFPIDPLCTFHQNFACQNFPYHKPLILKILCLHNIRTCSAWKYINLTILLLACFRPLSVAIEHLAYITIATTEKSVQPVTIPLWDGLGCRVTGWVKGSIIIISLNMTEHSILNPFQ